MDDREARHLVVPVVGMGEGYVVVNKPAGLLSVRGKGPDKTDCVVSRVASMFPEATGPLIVHRLDMDTSGLMVVALDASSQRHLSRQFETRTVEKRYVALLEGLVGAPGDEGVIDLPMRLDIENRPYQIVDHEQGKPSVTEWRIIGHDVIGERECTRIEFSPTTGRSHQLRVHAAAGLRAPILGDVLYGAGEASASRLMLHATMLRFDDPLSDERASFESDPAF